MTYRYFAFLDVLAYREQLKRDTQDGTTAFKDKLISAFASLSQVNESDVSISAISDSVFLTLQNESLGFSFFAKVVKDLQVAFIDRGLLLRGGISFNLHFENGKVTYSPALVDAHEMESKHAFFPRVVIHSAVIEKLQNEGGLDQIVGDGLIVQHAEKYHIHFIDDGNWETLRSGIAKIADSSRSAIDADPRIYAKHWYLQEYLAAFRPPKTRFTRYLPSWKRR